LIVARFAAIVDRTREIVDVNLRQRFGTLRGRGFATT